MNYNKIFESVENPQWRVFKVIDTSGICRQNKIKINSAAKLEKFIGDDAKIVYVSVSQFLNPHKITTKLPNGKKGYINADRILLSMDLYFDLDNYNLNVAQKDGRKIIQYIEKNEPNFEFRKIVFSGNKGFKLLFKQKTPYNVEDPIERINCYEKKRKSLINKMMKKITITSLDQNYISVWSDPMRVCPLDYTYKKYPVQPIPFKRFMEEDIYNLLSSLSPLFGTLKTREADLLANDTQVTLHCDQGKKRSSLSSCSTFLFITNRVHGTRLFTTVLKYRKEDFKEKLVKKVQKIYGLDDFYIEQLGDYIYAYNTKAIQFGRVLKIMKCAKSMNYNEFRRTQHIHIQISPDKNKNGEVGPRPVLIKIIKSKLCKDRLHSKCHSSLIGFKYNNLIGENNSIMTEIKYSRVAA